MYARVTTFEGGDAAGADSVIEEVKKRLETEPTPPGASRFLMLMNAEGGTGLGVYVFDDLATLEAAESFFSEMRPAAPEAGFTPTSQKVYEVPVDTAFSR